MDHQEIPITINKKSNAEDVRKDRPLFSARSRSLSRHDVAPCSFLETVVEVISGDRACKNGILAMIRHFSHSCSAMVQLCKVSRAFLRSWQPKQILPMMFLVLMIDQQYCEDY